MRRDINPLLEIYLRHWGQCKRLGWREAGLDYPAVEMVYRLAAPSGGEFVEAEYVKFIDKAINLMEDKPKKAVEHFYWHERNLSQGAQQMRINRKRFREYLLMGESMIYGFLKYAEVLR